MDQDRGLLQEGGGGGKEEKVEVLYINPLSINLIKLSGRIDLQF